MITLDFSGL